MTPADALIIAFAALDFVFLIVLAVVGLRFRALAVQGGQRVRPLIQRGQHIAVTGKRLAATARTRGDSILTVTKALAHDVSAKIETTRRIVSEVIHPETSSLERVARTVEQGQAWTARLTRLGAAARRAADRNGGERRRV
jgi:hypothetical protein